MTDVLVYPQSGYANRLQAIASSALLAEWLGGRLWVCWEHQQVAAATAEQVFDPAFVATHVVGADEALERWGVRRGDIPLYLTVDADRHRVLLAGHDRGEQHFMPALRSVLDDGSPRDLIVVVAGGKFTLDGGAVLSDQQRREFDERRGAYYRALDLHPDIESRVEEVVAGRGPFLGLHLRYSDRSTQAPMRRRIAPALRRLSDERGLHDLFVASDTPGERDRWHRRAEGLGLHPWSADPGDLPRSDPRSALGALVDWRILGRSQGMVYFAESSFAEEASVASGWHEASIGLAASRVQAWGVRAAEYSRAAVTYPKRHWSR